MNEIPSRGTHQIWSAMKRSLSIVAFALCLVATAGISALHENVGPSTEDRTIAVDSPSGKFSLVQAPAHSLKGCDEQGGWPCFQTTVRNRNRCCRKSALRSRPRIMTT